jgi:hypothetical protein
MLSVVKIVNATRSWYEAGAAVRRRGVGQQISGKVAG